MKKIEVKTNELRAITWMEDVEGLVVEDCGDTVKIYYEAMPSFWEKEISKEDFYAIVNNTTEKLN